MFAEHPKEVNKAFNGLVVPCLCYNKNFRRLIPATGAYTAPVAIYMVYAYDIMRKLATYNKAASAYLSHIGFPETEDHLYFIRDQNIEVIRKPPNSSELPREAVTWCEY
jgi:hypothetical protein